LQVVAQVVAIALPITRQAAVAVVAVYFMVHWQKTAVHLL
jgi:hypothetical protein